MTQVLTIPPSLDHEAFDELVADTQAAGDGRILFDARHVRAADPYGLIGLLTIGQTVAEHGSRPMLQLPQNPEGMNRFARMGFLPVASDIFEMPASRPRAKPEAGNVLLEITPIRSHEDVRGVIDDLSERAGAILTETVGYSGSDAMGFSMMLSEVCQNITEHAESGGWVGIQAYRRLRKLGRAAVVIAVMDMGVGFRGSLAREHAARFGERWSDATALEAAFIHGVTRFRDPGRGQGLKQIRKSVGRWGGKIAIRSGTARIADVAPWEDTPPLETGLAPMPGSQILIILPAKNT